MPAIEKPTSDIEKGSEKNELMKAASKESIIHGDVQKTRFSMLKKFSVNAEARGLDPVPEEEQTDQRAFSLFTLWFSANFCLLP